MREILFRGKKLDNGEWVEGFYHYTNWYDPHTFEMVDTHYWILPIGKQDAFEVDPATVGQYTGVEAHGKKIFEGDIVEYNGRRYCAKYYPPFAMYMFSRKNCGTNGTLIPLHECVVIGNIHDNPELLEG